MLRFYMRFLLVAAVLCGSTVPAMAQVGGRVIPKQQYYLGLGKGGLYDADYLNAMRVFKECSQTSIKTVQQSRWIDSICYETMWGEAYFQMGNLREALLHYTYALEVFKLFPDWMTQVEFQPPVLRASARKMVPWGSSKRQSTPGAFSSSQKIAIGSLALNMQAGAVVQQATFFPITPQEIVRCTALALRRRALLLGPLSRHDPLTDGIIAAMNRPLGPPNHWSECWVNIEHGLALIAGGREDQGIAYLQKGVMAGGEFDHPLTSVALLELGRQSLFHGNYPEASKFLEEATYAAVNSYGSSLPSDLGVLEEAFRYAAIVHLLENPKAFFPPLEQAIPWAKKNHCHQLYLSLLLSAAENYAVLGQSAPAAAALKEARLMIGQRKQVGRLGARLNYLNALVCYQQRHIAEGDASIGAAMNYMHGGGLQGGGSLWLFQIAMADELYARGGGITPRIAFDLYGELLRDPRPGDWMLDPMESLAASGAPQVVPFEHWFETAVQGTVMKDVQAAINIAELAKRRRFFTSLPLGGRLESLRWLLEAAPECLPQEGLMQRQDLLARYPAYDQLSRKARAIREALEQRPLVAEDQAALKAQMQQLGEMAAAGAQQEAILREIALRREPADPVFPPSAPVAEIQKALPDKHAALVFFAAGRNLHAFLLDNKHSIAHWQIATPQALGATQAALRDMGLFGPNNELAVKDIAQPDEPDKAKWRQSGRRLLDILLKGSPEVDLSQPFDELAIVPDSFVWYVPFEALQVTVNGKPQSLITRFRIRYVPALALCVSQRAGRTAIGNTAVMLGKLSPHQDDALAQAAFERLAAVVPGAVMLKPPLPAAAHVYATLFRRLIVLDDLLLSNQNPLGWSPLPLGKGSGTLNDWLSLPWGGPEVVILPGFHTVAEDSLKRMDKTMPGNDVFLAVCGLTATGARTALLSRWRTGGRSSYDLVQEFAQELPHTSAPDAWQRAVMLANDSRLNLEAEPRVKRGATEEAPKAEHPLFWAGYMLVDCGAPLEKTEKTVEKKEKTEKAEKTEKTDKKEKPEQKPNEAIVKPKPKK